MYFVPSFRPRGPSWRRLVSSRRRLGAILGLFVRLLGAIWAVFGAIWASRRRLGDPGERSRHRGGAAPPMEKEAALRKPSHEGGTRGSFFVSHFSEKRTMACAPLCLGFLGSLLVGRGAFVGA